jgi:hypothetical protein
MLAGKTEDVGVVEQEPEPEPEPELGTAREAVKSELRRRKRVVWVRDGRGGEVSEMGRWVVSQVEETGRECFCRRIAQIWA